MPRPKQRTPELRDHVLATAIELLASGGVGGLTTRRIAREAGTSPPAIYELFGDKAGLVREIFLEGFDRLRRAFDAVPTTADARADVLALIDAFRGFARREPELNLVMFSRPVSDFRPGPDELRAAIAVHDAVLARVLRAIDAGLVAGDPVDIAHAFMATAQGLAAAENAGILGTSPASRDRRWSVAVEALLRGLAPHTPER